MKYLIILWLCCCHWIANAQTCTQPTNVNVDGSISSGSTVYQADQTINAPAPSASLVITGTADLQFVAGTQITLGPGTEVGGGGKLHAYIAPCTNKNDLLSTTSGFAPKSSLVIYPNPFNNSVTIDLQVAVEQSVSITLTDVFGKTVSAVLPTQTLSAGSYSYQITDADIAAGVYLVQVSRDNTLEVKRLVKVD